MNKKITLNTAYRLFENYYQKDLSLKEQENIKKLLVEAEKIIFKYLSKEFYDSLLEKKIDKIDLKIIVDTQLSLVAALFEQENKSKQEEILKKLKQSKYYLGKNNIKLVDDITTKDVAPVSPSTESFNPNALNQLEINVSLKDGIETNNTNIGEISSLGDGGLKSTNLSDAIIEVDGKTGSEAVFGSKELVSDTFLSDKGNGYLLREEDIKDLNKTSQKNKDDIKELNENLGNIDNLNTEVKDNLVDSINETYQKLGGDQVLTTKAQTAFGAINELNDHTIRYSREDILFDKMFPEIVNRVNFVGYKWLYIRFVFYDVNSNSPEDQVLIPIRDNETFLRTEKISFDYFNGEYIGHLRIEQDYPEEEFAKITANKDLGKMIIIGIK